MFRFLEEHRKKILPTLGGTIVLLSLVLGRGSHNASIVEDAIGFVVTPFQDLIIGVETWFNKTTSSTREKSNLIEENELLKQQLAEIIEDNKRLLLYEEENKRLSDLLRISEKYPNYKTIGANITSKAPGVWYQTFVINKGTSDEVHTNMILTSTEGLVGKVTESGTTYSQCQSILDSRSSVSAMSSRTKDLGVVKGDYILMQQGLCKMEYIDMEAQIIVGDEIVTSHLSDIYPEGLSIGKVAEIKIDTNGLTKYAIIEPYVDFKHLDTILVLDKDSTEERYIVSNESFIQTDDKIYEIQE